MIKLFYFSSVLFFLLNVTYAQEAEETIDASKPTNFYSFLDNTVEYTTTPSASLFGYRGVMTITPGDKHQIFAELPLLYNTKTEKFGISDIRGRYFYLPYKNYDNFFGAFGPSVDIYAPTGSYSNGLGTGRWILSPGVMAGLMVSEQVQFFPVLSYQYQSKILESVPENTINQEQHGITLQLITTLAFIDNSFFQVTPIYQLNDITEERKDRYVQEVLFAYFFAEKQQVSFFFRGNFQDDIYTVRAGYTLFF